MFVKFTSYYSVDDLLDSLNFHLLFGLSFAHVVKNVVTEKNY